VAKTNALVDSVTSGGKEASPADNDSDVIDRITGKTRHRQDAPAAAAAPTTGKKGEVAPSGSPPPPVGGVHADDDPLKGLL
jgi:hypothetical protein